MQAVTETAGRVRIGSWVRVREGSLVEGWRIVDPSEADAMRRLISSDTPLARALLGHTAGDTVIVRPPRGTRWQATVLEVA